MKTPLSVSHRLTDANSLILDFQGALTVHSKEALSSYHDILKENEIDLVVLNLSGLDHIDGSGLKLLTIFLFQVKNMGLKISAYSSDTELLHVFNLTHLDELIEIFPNETAALNRPEKKSKV